MAIRPAKDTPSERQISDARGVITEPWQRHFQIVADALKQIEGVDTLAPLDPGATTGEIVTQLNTLLSILQRAMR